MKTRDLWLVRIVAAGIFLAALMGGNQAVGQQSRGGGVVGGSTASASGGQQQQTGISQLPSAPNGKNASQIPGGDLDPGDGWSGKMQEQQAKSRNAERQKKLEVDTEKLLSLATELKEQVDKTDKNILSVDVIKKADEIEKLAKSVKERMKG